VLQEVQMFVSGKYLVTLHNEPLPALQGELSRLDGQVLHSEQFLLYRVFDALTDSFFPPLARIDDEIDELESQVLAGPTDEQLQKLVAMKRILVSLRKVVTPQRDLFARSIDQLAELPGLKLDERDYFRDVYDHLIRVSELIDAYRDLLSSTTDLYLSTVANRQNEVMKQLAIVGTVFLPLSFITGFFGMNFGWLVKEIDSRHAFLVWGVGGFVVPTVILLTLFWVKRDDWF
jgi:magnesium transporter